MDQIIKIIEILILHGFIQTVFSLEALENFDRNITLLGKWGTLGEFHHEKGKGHDKKHRDNHSDEPSDNEREHADLLYQLVFFQSKSIHICLHAW